MKHASIAMSDVQSRRNDVIIPNGGPLHSYANAYFDPRNPMMYKRQNIAESLCVLAISASVLDFRGRLFQTETLPVNTVASILRKKASRD